MKLSVIIPHYDFEGADELLNACVTSLTGYDELIVVVNKGIGFAKAVNKGLSLAKGDYLAVVSNDIVWKSGELNSLLIPDTVTSPRVNDGAQPFWGCFFVLPRNVYQQVGGLDEQFEGGYYEDDDYIKRLQEAQILMKCVGETNIFTKGGQTMTTQFNVSELMRVNKEKFDKKWSE